MTSERDVDEALCAWTVEGAPADFADRVLRATLPPEPRPLRAWAITGLAVAAALVLVLAWPRTDPGGSLQADTRTSIALRDAIAVAERGASLQWTIESETVRVDQRAGKVFYRVDSGHAVEVVTPQGVVKVHGTCFEVEVTRMDGASWRSGVAGVAVGAVVVVTLYEGEVVVAHARGETELRPGQIATLTDDGTPNVRDRDAPTVAVRTHGDADVRARRQAHAQAELEAQDDPQTEPVAAAPAGPDAEIERCGFSINRPGCSNVAPSQAVLDWRADCGIVVFDEPEAFTTATPDYTKLVDLTGLDEHERGLLEQTTREFHDRMRERFVAQYLALGGKPELAESLATSTLFSEVAELASVSLDPDAAHGVEQMVADARAGRIPEVDWQALPAAQQFAFLRLQAGEMFERELAARLGPSRARELREAQDGWTANRGMVGSDGRCFAD